MSMDLGPRRLLISLKITVGVEQLLDCRVEE